MDAVSVPADAPAAEEGKMLSVTAQGLVDVDGVKLRAVDIRYNMDMTGAVISKDTYALAVYQGYILENFGDGSIGDITDVAVDGDMVTLSLYTDYHLSSEPPFTSALAVSVTQVKDFTVGDRTVEASDTAVDNYDSANASGGASGGMRRGSGEMGGGKTARWGAYTIDGIEGFRYFTNNTSYGTPDGAPFHKDHSESQRTAASVLTAMSKPPAMRLRSNITRSTFPRIRIGCWQAFLQTTVFPAPTQRNATSLIA